MVQPGQERPPSLGGPYISVERECTKIMGPFFAPDPPHQQVSWVSIVIYEKSKEQ